MTQPQFPDLTYRTVDGGPQAPINTQLTVDCDDPHAQAAFWAAALGYLIEDGHDFVEAVVAAGFADRERDTIEIDGRLAWRIGTGIKHPDDVDGPRGSGRRILFVAVPDRAPGKNKWHLDLNVGRERDRGRGCPAHRAGCDRAVPDRRTRCLPHHHGRPRRQPVLRPVRPDW